jgi:hypothetical protein
MDEDLLIDDLVGEKLVRVGELINSEEKQWLELTYKGKKAAEILIEARLMRPILMRGEKRKSN